MESFPIILWLKVRDKIREKEGWKMGVVVLPLIQKAGVQSGLWTPAKTAHNLAECQTIV
jgi:hypothetical protein